MYTKNDVEEALSDAQRYTEEGEHERALERFVWYYENAPLYAPSHSAVRLTFGLHEWARLAKAYPPAMTRLIEARDTALVKFRQDPSDELMYSEVLSIDLAIEDMQAAREHSREAKEHGVSNSRLELEIGDILDSGDMEWAEELLGDPKETLEEILAQRASTFESLDSSYAYRIVGILKAVDQIRGREEALKLQATVLESLDSPKIRDALD